MTASNGGGTCCSSSSARGGKQLDETKARQESVKEYYGKKLSASSDLKTNACVTGGAPPDHIKECLKKIHPDVVAKYYGCGLCLPNYDLTGLTVLDLGCGSGRDVYIASQLVGPSGKVIGLDMTEEQLEVARKYESHHAERFGYDVPNTKFIQGTLESIPDLIRDGVLEPSSIDLIISNCVINLVQDKEVVLKSCHELLKSDDNGAEMYFSDVYCDRRVPEDLRRDDVLWGECISGSLYWNDFHNMVKRIGFADPRVVEDAPITVQNRQVQDKMESMGYGDIRFYSATYRLRKSGNLEPACEEYGQAVKYRGTVPRSPSSFALDKGHVFRKGRMHNVCGNTWHMLKEHPKLRDHFDFYGDFSTHYGIFEDCGGVAIPYDVSTVGAGAAAPSKGGGGGCC